MMRWLNAPLTLLIGLLIIVSLLGGFGIGLIVRGDTGVPPYPDPGHRFFGAKSESATAAMLRAIEKTAGYKPASAFDAGPTHQVVLNDGQRTVIAWLDEGTDGPPNAMSFAVENPHTAAMSAAAELLRSGFTAKITSLVAGGADLVIVESNAMREHGLVFRKPWYRLDPPPGRPLPR